MIQETRKISNRGIEVAIYVCVLYSIMPAISFWVPSTIRLLCSFVIFIYLLSRNSQQNYRFFLIFGALPVYILYIIDMLALMNADFVNVLYFTLNLYVLSVLFINIRIARDEELSRRLKLLCIIAFVINAITTYVGNEIFPHASRQLASIKYAGDMYEVYLRFNIGGFDTVYSFVLLIPMLIYCYKKTSSLIIRLIFILIVVLFELAIIKTDYTTAIVFSIISLFLFFMPLKFKVRKMFFLSLSFLILFFLLKDFVVGLLSDMLINVASSIDSKSIADRLRDVALLMQGENIDNNSDAASRIDLYYMSVTSFFSNPIIGTLKNGGGHSFILDALAKYGLIGLLSLLIMYSRIFKLYILPYKNCDIYSFLLFVFLLYIIFTLLNPQPYIVMISFVIPIICNSFVQRKASI